MTPKCRILCPTFGGHIILSPTLRLLLCNKREPSYWQHPLYLYYTPFPGLCQSFPASAQDNFAKSRRRAIAAHRAEFGLSKALSEPSAGYPSGGPFLVPPRKGERMRLKGGAVGKADVLKERLPPAIVYSDSLRDAPPSLKNSFRPQNQQGRCKGNTIGNQRKNVAGHSFSLWAFLSTKYP